MDTLREDIRLIHRLKARFGNLQHDRPVRTRARATIIAFLTIGKLDSRKLHLVGRLVVGRVIGEDGGTVEGTVVFREVKLTRHHS